MFYSQCNDCGERWELGVGRTCKCPNKTPKRKWGGLTDEDLANCESEKDVRFVRAIEAKLRSKNEHV